MGPPRCCRVRIDHRWPRELLRQPPQHRPSLDTHSGHTDRRQQPLRPLPERLASCPGLRRLLRRLSRPFLRWVLRRCGRPSRSVESNLQAVFLVPLGRLMGWAWPSPLERFRSKLRRATLFLLSFRRKRSRSKPLPGWLKKAERRALIRPRPPPAESIVRKAKRFRRSVPRPRYRPRACRVSTMRT